MKCKGCKKRMADILAEFEFNCDGVIKRAINVPAKRCSECGKIVIHEIIKERLYRYALNCDGTIVDYAKCENEEAVAANSLSLF